MALVLDNWNDVDSICHELAYQSDMLADKLQFNTSFHGYNSDCGYQSPGLLPEHEAAHATACAVSQYGDSGAAAADWRCVRAGRSTGGTAHSGLGWPVCSSTPVCSCTPTQSHCAAAVDASPATISSGYSSDKEEACLALDLEYPSSTENSPSRHAATLAPDQYYHNDSHNFQFSASRGKNLLRESQPHWATLPVRHTSKQTGSRSATFRARKTCPKAAETRAGRSKVASTNKRHSICESIYGQNTLQSDICMKRATTNSLSELSLPLSSTPSGSLSCRVPEPSVRLAKGTPHPAPGLPCERLPVMTDLPNATALPLTPRHASTPCHRCRVFASFSSTSLSPSLCRATRVSASDTSAFHTVSPSARSSSTHPGPTMTLVSEEREGLCDSATESSCEARLQSWSDDSGRGSASSFDLDCASRLSSCSERHSVLSEASLGADCPNCNNFLQQHIYQDINRNENIYEPVFPTKPSGLKPPELPKRNTSGQVQHECVQGARPTPRQQSSSLQCSPARRRSAGRGRVGAASYEDIVKPQDVVDVAAAHIYTVADVLDSVLRLAADIPETPPSACHPAAAAPSMCVHDNYAHFLSTVGQSCSERHCQQRRGSEHSCRPAGHRGYDAVPTRGRHFSQPLRPHVNTAAEAHTVRLPKLASHNKEARCVRPLHQEDSLSEKSRVEPTCGYRREDSGLSASPQCIAWRARGRLTEVYC